MLPQNVSDSDKTQGTTPRQSVHYICTLGFDDMGGESCVFVLCFIMPRLNALWMWYMKSSCSDDKFFANINEQHRHSEKWDLLNDSILYSSSKLNFASSSEPQMSAGSELYVERLNGNGDFESERVDTFTIAGDVLSWNPVVANYIRFAFKVCFRCHSCCYSHWHGSVLSSVEWNLIV